MTVRLTPDALVTDRPIGGGEGQRVLENADRNCLIEFELLASGYAGWPAYRCLVDGQPVGMTSPKFGQSLAELLHSGQRALVDAMEEEDNVVVEGRRRVVG